MQPTQKIPALFIGHGSPMNAISDNANTRAWAHIATRFPKPKAIVGISAHYVTSGLKITAVQNPKQIYDMYGFPEALYALKYPAIGNVQLAKDIANRFNARDIAHTGALELDSTWGIDHGLWSVLSKMYPNADIPVVAVSLDVSLPPQIQFDIGRNLAYLRDDGVLILASGAIVHNLTLMRWDSTTPFEWAVGFNEGVRELIVKRQWDKVVDFRELLARYPQSFYTFEHFYPLLIALGAANADEEICVFNENYESSAVSMNCYGFGIGMNAR